MEPYVQSNSDKKKKKKKSTSDPYVDNVELTDSKHKSAKDKKKKSKKNKSSSSKSSYKNASDDPYSSANAVEAMAYPVLEASGFEPLLIEDINKIHSGYSKPNSSGGSNCKFAITGHESQIVTVAIPPGQSCQGEPGSMMYLSDPISMKVSCGSDWFGRCCGGESCCVLNFNNNTNQVGYAGLVTNDPLAKVVPVEMDSPAVGGSLIVQQGAYMASYGDVKITYDCDCNLVRCCCGGMGLVRQKLEGNGTAFLGATGTIVQKVLDHNETILIDTNCILAYAETCTFDLKKTGGIVNWIGGGEGIFNSSLKGPGLVVVQSMNMCMLLQSLVADKMYRR